MWNINSPSLLALELVDRPQDVTESPSCLEIKEAFGLKMAEQHLGLSNLNLFFFLIRNTKWVPHRQLGESRIVDPASKCVLLELQELDNQTCQGLTGRGVILDVLSRRNNECH